MSEEVQETESTNEVEDTNEVSSSLADVEDVGTLKKMIKALRSENAASRQKNNAKEGELTEYRKWKESQMSELEKVKEREAVLEKRLKTTLAEKLAIEYGVDDSLKEFIVGESEDEMKSRAQKLGSRKGSDNSSDDEKVKARLLGGNRGSAVGKINDGSNRPAGTSSEAAWFKELYENK